jgi:hypothetical protein
MKRKITMCLFGLAVAVSLVLFNGALAHATSISVVPTILFGQEDDPDGTYALNYFGPSSDPSFEIAASIAVIEGIDFNGIGDPEEILATGRLFIYGTFQSVEQVDDNGKSTITASFTTTTTLSFSLVAGYGEFDPEEWLLAGDLINMQITGEEDATTVKADATLEFTDGLLLDQFGTEAELSADIDLIDTEFSTKLFQNYFSGTIAKGSINSTQVPEPVPEPGTLVLMSLGCVGLITCWRRRAKKY